MARSLTAKQEKFIDGVVGGLSQSEAYRQAGYKVDDMSVESIAREACRIAKAPHISPIIEQRRRELADKAIWSREQALAMLRDIAVDANQNRREKLVVSGGEVTVEKYNAAAQNVAIKAIEQANKMCGYNAPDRTELTVSKSLEDII